MKSGLEGRNNRALPYSVEPGETRLNEVRPRRPEQCDRKEYYDSQRKVSMKSGLEGRNNSPPSVQPRGGRQRVSMKSGLEGRNNDTCGPDGSRGKLVSMKSGLEGRNNLGHAEKLRDGLPRSQ